MWWFFERSSGTLKTLPINHFGQFHLILFFYFYRVKIVYWLNTVAQVDPVKTIFLIIWRKVLSLDSFNCANFFHLNFPFNFKGVDYFWWHVTLIPFSWSPTLCFSPSTLRGCFLFFGWNLTQMILRSRFQHVWVSCNYLSKSFSSIIMALDCLLL